MTCLETLCCGVFTPVLAKHSMSLSLVDAGRDRILSVRITRDPGFDSLTSIF